MNNKTQPPFWLEVKKEYIIENFENMLSYLCKYEYNRDEDNTDFDKTFNCLKEVVDDIMKTTQLSNLYELSPYNNYPNTLIIRILATYLLTYQKKGGQDLPCVACLANILLLLDAVTLSETMDKMYKVLYNCLCQRTIVSYNYTWRDISNNKDFSINTFCYQFADVQFTIPEEEAVFYYENKGIIVAQNNCLTIAPLNYDDYKKKETIIISSFLKDVTICVKKEDKIKASTFNQLVELNNILSSKQDSVKASPIKRLKTYTEEEDEIIVKVTYIDDYIHAETIDPNYNVLKGSVYIPNYLYSIPNSTFIIKGEDLKSSIKLNHYLKVSIQENPKIPFVIKNSFAAHYLDIAKDSASEKMRAVYDSDYSFGKRWIAENGLIVNIKSPSNEDIQDAIDQEMFIYIKVTEAKQDSKGNNVVNGIYECCEEYEENDENFSIEDFKANARFSVIESFFNWSIPTDVIEPELKNIFISKEFIIPFVHLYYKRGNGYSTSTQEHYENLIAAKMIAKISEIDTDIAYISHGMKYICNLVRFAEGDRYEDLTLTHEKLLDGNAIITRREDIIHELSNYKGKSLTGEQTAASINDDIIGKIHDLVKASNILVDKIDEQEISRIKKRIASLLEVSDMYKNECCTSTYYGDESDSLEFKSSIIYPAGNKQSAIKDLANPGRQKWEILKAVCGFLNSMYGGEILLGVRDNGSPCGLKEDIDYLYKNKRITDPTMDKFILYVKRLVDNAFIDVSGIISDSKDITQVRVKYFTDNNKEKNPILRIQVSPYEYGIVRFKNEMELPNDIASSYQRSSNTTTALSTDMMKQLNDKRLSAKVDGVQRIFLTLQKAKKERKVIILTEYNSCSGIKNRNIEPYKILFGRNAVIGYDLDSKALREYKINRFKEVILTDKSWKNYKPKYEDAAIDLFDMLQSREDPIHIILKLKHLSYNLLIEEHTEANASIKKNTDKDSNEYPWILDTMVNSLYGVGRFYIGLMDYIKIVEGEELKQYTHDYIQRNTHTF